MSIGAAIDERRPVRPTQKMAQLMTAGVAWRLMLLGLLFPSLFISGLARAADAGFTLSRFHDSQRDRPVLIDWWYPVRAGLAEPYPYGLGEGRVAEQAPVLPGRFPLVLLSHGAFGAPRNYSWLAEALARNGYVVAGVAHYGESYVYGVDTVSQAAVLDATSRVVDLHAAWRYARTDGPLAAAIDTDQVVLAGHSSGGATALLAAGMTLSPSKLAHYCSTDVERAHRVAVAPGAHALADAGGRTLCLLESL
ncbi:MAG: alpha/beta hydrolase [Pseudomonadota bacterium]